MLTIVTHPEATLEVLNPHIGHSGVFTGHTGEALVLSPFTEARLQV